MSQSEYSELMYTHKEFIMNKWYDGLNNHFPGFYNRDLTFQEADPYFQFMLEFEIPTENHDQFQKIPHLCEHFFQRKIPIDHIILRNQLWVDAILYFWEQQCFEDTIPFELIRNIFHRIHNYERYFINHYNNMTHEIVEKHEQTMNDLHEARLTTVGKMAASMAHEIRNPLTTIVGFLKLVKRQISNNTFDKIASYLDVIESEFQTIQMQITGFLSFSKKDIVDERFEKTSVNTLTRSVVNMVNPRLIDCNIIFVFETEDDIELKLQKIAILQVISNILNNSIDALMEIETERYLIIRSQKLRDTFTISVTNNGPEIPKRIRRVLFEPFVTSKKHGTGLGLSICKQIMNKNSGDITYNSNPRETTFQIVFQIPSSHVEASN